MFEQTDFFQQYDEEKSHQFGGLGNVGRAAGKWLGFAAIVTILAFSGYHGVNATLQYRAGSVAGILTGIVGIITVEVILFSLILRWHNRGVTGHYQRVAAGVTFAIGFVLIFLAVLTDSRLNAGLELTPELAFYLLWVLPASPLIMGALNHIVDELAPEQLWSREQAEESRKLEEVRFRAHIAAQQAELAARKVIANANLNARISAARQVAAYYQSEPVQAAIRQSALASVPALLRATGVDPTAVPGVNRNGRVDEQDLAAYLQQHPEAAGQLLALLQPVADPPTPSGTPATAPAGKEEREYPNGRDANESEGGRRPFAGNP
jgi:hypothetical protein